MTRDGRNEMTGDNDPEIREIPSCLGWGGVVIDADGTQHPMEEHDALSGAIPLWATMPEHDGDTARLCIGFSGHTHPAVRAAAIGAFAAIASRHGTLAPRDEIIRSVAGGLADADENVRARATHVADILEASLGWQVRSE